LYLSCRIGLHHKEIATTAVISQPLEDVAIAHIQIRAPEGPHHIYIASGGINGSTRVVHLLIGIA